MNTYNPMVKFLGASPKFYFWGQFVQNIDGFRQNNSQCFVIKFIKLYKQNPLEKFISSWHEISQILFFFLRKFDSRMH